MTISKIVFALSFFTFQMMQLKSDVTPDNFMETLADDIRLRNLSILGSHDAGTYGLEPSLGVAPDKSKFLRKLGNAPLIGDIVEHVFIMDWAKAQSNDIKAQLNSGVRYFDLRIAVDSYGEYRICHGLYGPQIDEILFQFKRFLKKHPKEIVFLDFQHLYDNHGNEMTSDEQNLLVAKIEQSLGAIIAPPSFGTDVTLGQMRKANSQVIIFWTTKETAANYPSLLWDRTTYLSSTWYNLTKWKELKESLNQGIEKQEKLKFFVNQAVLTPDAKLILSNLSSDLLSIGTKVNAKILQWYKQKAVEGNAGSILMIDNIATAYYHAFQISYEYNKNLSR